MSAAPFRRHAIIGVSGGSFLKSISMVSPMLKRLSQAITMSLTAEKYEKFLSEAGAKYDERFAANACPKAEISQFRSCRTIGGSLYTRKFIAKDKKTKEEFIIRKIDKKLIKMKHLQKEMVREKKTQFAMESPFIDKLFYAFQDEKSLYFVTEYPLYGTLEKIYDVWDLVPGDIVKPMMGQVILGLEYLHACKLLYRNLKPANILVFADGYLKLTGFNKAAKLISFGWVQSAVGTISYMAPEQFQTDSIDHNIDWWSFGVLLYELLLGEHPFAHGKVVMRDKDLIDLIKKAEFNMSEEQRETIGPEAEDLLINLLQKEVQDRLGAQGNGPKAVKEHKWFADLDFLKLYEKKIPLQCRWKPERYDVHVSADNSFRSTKDSSDDYIEDF